MSLRDSLQLTFRRLSGELLPEALENAGHRIASLRKRLDHLNCSLADRALPALKSVKAAKKTGSDKQA